jgi:hypothetical protein
MKYQDDTPNPHYGKSMKKWMISRRSFLRGAGVTLALPWLEAMAPAGFGAAAGPLLPRRRMVCMNYALSLHPEYFFATGQGRDYQPSRYLEVLKDLRNDFTVFSGLSNPGMESAGGHGADVAFLTGAAGVGKAGFRNTISLDQLVASHIGLQTRLPYVSLSSTLSVSRNGVGVATAGANAPSKLYAQLFLDGTKQEVEQQTHRLRQGQSVMDAVLGQAKQLEKKIGHGDREKLDEYFEAVREVEQRLVSAEDWAKKPKPKVPVPQPKDTPNNGSTTMRLYYDLMHLAFQTDSTRLFTTQFVHWGLPPLDGVTYDHHNLSHNGKDPEKIRQLAIVDSDMFVALRDFLTKLKTTQEEGETLLDRTMVLVGSHMHSGGHLVNNLPVLLAGGRFKHGQHLAFDPESNTPLCNLYVPMLRQFGLDAQSFGTSTGAIRGLETA